MKNEQKRTKSGGFLKLRKCVRVDEKLTHLTGLEATEASTPFTRSCQSFLH